MRTRRDSHAARLIRRAAFLTLAAALLQGCSSGAPVPADNMQPPPGHGPYTGTVADWPLWFIEHEFGAYCFSTVSCVVNYAGFAHGGESPRPSLAAVARPGVKILRAGWGPYRNFPAPAKVRWTSSDGTRLEASVDVSEILADRMIRHTVAREDIKEGTSIPAPGVILVVDDRRVSIYMSTWIALKEPRNLENPHSDLYTGLILVHSKTY